MPKFIVDTFCQRFHSLALTSLLLLNMAKLQGKSSLSVAMWERLRYHLWTKLALGHFSRSMEEPSSSLACKGLRIFFPHETSAVKLREWFPAMCVNMFSLSVPLIQYFYSICTCVETFRFTCQFVLCCFLESSSLSMSHRFLDHVHFVLICKLSSQMD